jgi:chorismate-pyruvate lyase
MTIQYTPYILESLVTLFYPCVDDLGDFAEVPSAAIPAVYQTLLAHQNHMTVTVERYHGSPVDVRVLETRITGEHYARKILLARQSDGAVVQFGIVRLNFAHVDAAVRREVESQQIPLGRVLIAHNVHREVHLLRLWRIEPGPDLQKLFGLSSTQPIYGRTAIIDCNGEPAIELLEIVAPAGE